jgi:hypothetical protein
MDDLENKIHLFEPATLYNLDGPRHSPHMAETGEKFDPASPFERPNVNPVQLPSVKRSQIRLGQQITMLHLSASRFPEMDVRL